MKKIINYLFSFLQFGFIIYCIAVQYFTKTRMGMARHVLFKNREWAINYPLDSLLNTFSIILILLILLSIVLIVKNRSKISSLVLIIFSVVSLFFVKVYNVETYTSYYFTVLGLIAIVVVQFLMVLVNLNGKSHNKI